MTATPNHALQRTPGFGVQLPSAALVRPAQSRAVLPAMKPGTARAFASRRCAHSRAPGPESLSLGSLGVTAPLHLNERFSMTFCLPHQLHFDSSADMLSETRGKDPFEAVSRFESGAEAWRRYVPLRSRRV